MLGKPHTIKAKKKFLEALKKRRGIVTLACKEADVSPMTFYRWQNDDSEFYQMSDEIRDVEIGIIAEDRLAEYIIVHKDPNMIRFYLQSRSRKYIQRLCFCWADFVWIVRSCGCDRRKDQIQVQ